MTGSYPEFTITIGGKDIEQARQWFLDLEREGAIEVIRWGKRWTIGGLQYRHLSIRLISGQTSLFPSPHRPQPEPGSVVLGHGQG